jgi:hypothetical protein
MKAKRRKFTAAIKPQVAIEAPEIVLNCNSAVRAGTGEQNTVKKC